MQLKLGAALALSCVLAPSVASAHLGLVSPTSRYGSGVLKDGPCGMVGGTRSDNVTTFEPGQTIEVVWEEYIDHPSHYRIAFDPDGDDDLTDPACLSGCDTRTPEIERNTPGVMVLLDGIEDRVSSTGDNTYRATVTLPDIECDNCTLQVIQVMYDKPPQTRPGNDIYYQCADLVLARGADVDSGVPSADAGTMGGVDGGSTGGADGGIPGSDAGTEPMDDGGCGCRAAPGSSGALGLPLALLVALMALRLGRARRA